MFGGQLDKKTQITYFLSITTIFAIICVIAQALYPVPYDWRYDHVSHQGGWKNNPEGSMLWNISLIILGILYIPHIMFIYHELVKISEEGMDENRYIGISAWIGFSLVGVLPEDLVVWHQIPAVLFFFGFIIWMDLCLPPLITKVNKPNQEKWKKNFLKFWYVGENVLFLLTLFVPIIEYNPNWHIGSWIVEFAFWEWLLFISIFVSMANFFFFIEDDALSR